MKYDLSVDFENMSRGELIAHIEMIKAELREKLNKKNCERCKDSDYKYCDVCGKEILGE